MAVRSIEVFQNFVHQNSNVYSIRNIYLIKLVAKCTKTDVFDWLANYSVKHRNKENDLNMHRNKVILKRHQ